MTVNQFAGFGRSDRATFTIETGGTGEGADPVNLLRPYAFLVVRIPDCQYIQSSGNSLTLKVAMGENDTMCDLYKDDGSEFSIDTPTSGTFQVQLNVAMGVQRVLPVLSGNTSGGTTEIEIYGCDPLL